MQFILRDEMWILQGVMGLDAVVQSEHFGIEISLQAIYTLVFDINSE